MAQVQYLQVPGWERFPSGDDKHMMECSYKLSHCHISGNNNNNNISSTVSNNNTVNSNASAISTSSSNSTLTVNGRCSDVVVNANDKYTAAIELSNRCREFYNSRLAAASSIKSRWSVPQAACDNHAQENNNNTSSSVLPSLSSSTPSSPTSSSSSTSLSSTSNCSKVNTPDVGNTKRRTNSIDQAMDRLRTEMISLMEQDLSLMKQLLTLNETIEELKWQRQYYSCSTSYASLSPSGRLLSSSSWRPGEDGQGSSTWSVSDTEMYESDDDLRGLNSTIESTGLGAGAVPPGPPSLETSTSSSGTLTPSVGGSPSSAASLAIAQHQIQPPPTGLMTEPTWHSTRKARRASRESNQISLDSLNIRLDHTGDGEGGLAAEVHAALRKRAEDKDLSLFPAAFLDSYRRRSIRDSIEDQTHSRDTKLSKQLAAKHKASPASPISSGNNCKFTSDHLDLTPGPIIRHDRDQHSFDSGIHEPGTLSEEIVWNV